MKKREIRIAQEVDKAFSLPFFFVETLHTVDGPRTRIGDQHFRTLEAAIARRADLLEIDR